MFVIEIETGEFSFYNARKLSASYFITKNL